MLAHIKHKHGKFQLYDRYCINNPYTCDKMFNLDNSYTQCKSIRTRERVGQVKV